MPHWFERDSNLRSPICKCHTLPPCMLRAFVWFKHSPFLCVCVCVCVCVFVCFETLHSQDSTMMYLYRQLDRSWFAKISDRELCVFQSDPNRGHCWSCQRNRVRGKLHQERHRHRVFLLWQATTPWTRYTERRELGQGVLFKGKEWVLKFMAVLFGKMLNPRWRALGLIHTSDRMWKDQEGNVALYASPSESVTWQLQIWVTCVQYSYLLFLEILPCWYAIYYFDAIEIVQPCSKWFKFTLQEMTF